MNPKNYCQKCHQPLAPGALICPSCGAPTPGVYLFEPPQPPAAAGPVRSRRGTRFWLGLAGIIGGSLCTCLALVLGFFYLTGASSKPPAISQSNPPAAPPSITQPPSTVPVPLITPPTEVPAVPPAPAVTPTAMPTVPPTQAATPTETPTQPPTQEPTLTPAPADSTATQFFDDFSDINGGWMDVFNDSYSMGYFQKGNYAIALRVPQQMAVAFPPYPFPKPVKNITVSVKVQGSGGNGFYGVLCHYQDPSNYYRVSFSGDQYMVDQMVNGQYTALTNPFWQKITAYQPDAAGYITVTVACTDGRIQILVDEMGQEIITATDLVQGDAALFAASGTEKDSSGVYEQAYFDDFSAELQP